MKRRPHARLRHRLYRRLHPRVYRAGALAEQRHPLDGPLDYTRTDVSAAPSMAAAKERLGIPPVVVLCGSTRFWERMAAAAWSETLRGRIVVRPDVDMKRPRQGYADAVAVKTDLDALHRAKIRLADEVLVVGDYIGDSTRAEIAYARELGMPVRFTHPEVDAPAPASALEGAAS
ncbi:hypothetical protein GKJPGBOP_05457 [Streptomyces paromomycinus]|uniref:Uncharacterized protein n=2 Tax=Streptomyces paromomycinus TaxID=92743 RepID=A0A401W8U0_STREY|nr:hypothetical protein GKJPGBOP_05457 [Streptomyces paromomycinus]